MKLVIVFATGMIVFVLFFVLHKFERSWEKASTGRAKKSKASREKFLEVFFLFVVSFLFYASVEVMIYYPLSCVLFHINLET